jgi:hypothetical protein
MEGEHPPYKKTVFPYEMSRGPGTQVAPAYESAMNL